jgi:hypothetical protein
MEIYELNEKQKQAFKELKKAAEKCAKLKIGFVNVLDSCYAFNKDFIKDMDIEDRLTDKDPDKIWCLDYGYPYNSMKTIGGSSFADDQIIHFFRLTKKGIKAHQEECE